MNRFFPFAFVKKGFRTVHTLFVEKKPDMEYNIKNSVISSWLIPNDVLELRKNGECPHLAEMSNRRRLFI